MLRRRTRGFTLVELVISLAILTIALAGIFGAMWSAMSATREAKPRFLAKQAASRLLAEFEADSASLELFYKNYWRGDAGPFPGKLSAAEVKNVGTAAVYVDCDLLLTTAFPKSTFQEILEPALDAKIMQRQGMAPMLRLRFLSEDQYNKLWGVPSPDLAGVDLNFNSTTDDGIELAGGAAGLGPDYKMYPIQVSVHWRDEGGDQVLRVTTMITADPNPDDQRK